MLTTNGCAPVRDNPVKNRHIFKKYNVPLVEKFLHALCITSTNYVSSIKFHMFKEIYPNLYENAPNELENIHGQLQIQMNSIIVKDLAKLCSQQNIFSLLNSLDRIKEKQLENHKVKWRSSGHPIKDIQDPVYKEKLKERDKLKCLLEEMTSRNEKRETVMYNNHAQILELKEDIQNLSQTVINGVDFLGFLAFSETKDKFLFSGASLRDILSSSD